MGIFDGLLGGAVSALGSYFGQKSTNQSNTENVNQTNATNIELANTAHQREVKDLISAGLNPILSANRSGSPMPSLQVPQLQSPTAHAVSSAAEAYKIQQDVSRSRTEQRGAEQQQRIKVPVETGAGMVQGGLQSIQAAAQGAAAGVAQVAGSKLAESVTGTVASAVETVKETAAKYGVTLASVLDAPSKFVSSVVNSAADASRMFDTKVDAPVPRRGFAGTMEEVIAEIKRIKDPADRAAAMRQMMKQTHFVKRRSK